MATPEPHNVTALLESWSNGDPEALQRLMPLVYEELRRIALNYLRHERPDHTLQCTALVHEAYMRMVNQKEVSWQNRSHFFGVAAQSIRHILVDYARAHNAEMRAGGLQRVELQEGLRVTNERSDEVLALHEALTHLEGLDPRQAKVVELRYFGGFSVEDIGEILEISPRSVKRHWALARIWLLKQMKKHGGESLS